MEIDNGALIRYLADCYVADNRTFSIDNFFSKKFENHFIQDLKEELINNKYPKQYLPADIGKKTLQNLQLNSNDKQLYYCSFFIIGRRQHFNNRIERICAPVLYFPAEIVSDGDYYFLKLDPKDYQVNFGFLRTLNFKTSFAEFQNDVNALLNYPEIDLAFITGFERCISDHILNLSVDDSVDDFPTLLQDAMFKSHFKKLASVAPDQFTMYAVSGSMVSSRFKNTTGVIVELQQLVKESLSDADAPYSSAIESYFGTAEPKLRKGSYIPDMQPFVLNDAQLKVLKSANREEKSILIGPPGTGKSYTVTAIAVDYLAQGKSVMVATRTEEAIGVISKKLSAYGLEDYVVEASGPRYLQKMVKQLERFVFQSEKDLRGKVFESLSYGDKGKAGRETNVRLLENLRKTEEEFLKVEEKSSKLSQIVLSNQSFMRDVKMNWIKLFNKWQIKEWRLIKEYVKLLQRNLEQAQKTLRGRVRHKLYQNFLTHRDALYKYLTSLRDKDRANKASSFRNMDFSIIVKALPIWLVKIDQVSEVLPLQKEMFDLLIIDEATHCDMASILPLMQRAKKIVVTGDPKQMRHVSFLSKAAMHGLCSKHDLLWSEQLNYRNSSVLDYAMIHMDKDSEITLLNEHFRSLPAIIRFSNQRFYDGELLIMKDLPKYKQRKVLTKSPVKGTRNKKGINEEEADFIVDYLATLIKREDHIEKGKCTTLGIISPFADQVKHIVALFKERFRIRELAKHDVRVGTPYSFQGDERDVIILSLALDDDTHHSAHNYLNREDVFNVMITRARNRQIVLCSASIEKLKPNSVLRAYLEDVEDGEDLESKHNEHYDNFYEEVSHFLETQDLKLNIYKGYVLSGLVIDMLIEKNNKYIGIDLIGYPGDFESSFSLERYRILYRMGIEVIPLSYPTWYFDGKIRNALVKHIYAELS